MASCSGPSVSLVIVSHNGRKYLGACLDSLFSQSYPMEQVEVILVDNGSRDGTGEWIKESYPQVKLVEVGRNLGFAKGCNEGARLSSGKHIGFLNQDTVVHRNWLEGLVECLEREPERWVCHSCTFMPWTSEFSHMDLQGEPRRLWFYDVGPLGSYRYIAAGAGCKEKPTLGLTGGAFLMRRLVLEQYGYVFDEKFSAYCEDLDLGLRVWCSGRKVYLAGRSVVFHDQKVIMTPGRGDLKKALRASANRLTAFWKNCAAAEFWLVLPLLLVDMLLKPLHLHVVWPLRLAMGLAMVPVAFCSLFWAAARFPKVRAERARLRSLRRVPNFWVLTQLLKRDLS